MIIKSNRCSNSKKGIIEAKNIISNIHPEATINLINTPLIRNVYKERIRSLENTISNFTVYIKFKENKVPYLNSNFTTMIMKMFGE